MRSTRFHKFICMLLAISVSAQMLAAGVMPCQTQSQVPVNQTHEQAHTQSMPAMDHSQHASMDVSAASEMQMNTGMDCCQDCDCSDGCFMTALINTSLTISNIEHHQWVSPYFSSISTAITNTLYRPPISR